MIPQPDPWAERIFTEAGGDRQAAINRLRAKGWWETEAEVEIDRLILALREPSRDQAKRAGASGG